MRPIHAFILVLLFGGLVWAADFAIDGGFSRDSLHERVTPGRDGTVRIEVGDLAPNAVRFYRFLNAGNQEVKFFIGRDTGGHIQVAFDANEVCYKLQRGYTANDGWMTCNKCDKSFELTGINAGGGGCKPVPLVHRVEGETVVLNENDILTGWRYFR